MKPEVKTLMSIFPTEATLYLVGGCVRDFIIDSFFIKDQISKTPILDASENEYYTDGFYLKRKTFLKYVEQAEILNKNLLIESYDYLFGVYFSSGNL